MSAPVAVLPVPASALAAADLERELLGLAGHLAAAQCRFLGLVAEFDRRQAWAGPGLRSCAHWLSWRIGMSLRTAFEQIRVAHALAGLPRLRAAFADGRVSYSKVRAITRVATPETEQALFDLALAGTASHVEHVVRAARRLGADPARAAAERAVTWSWSDDGSLVLRARLPAAEGAAWSPRSRPSPRFRRRPLPARNRRPSPRRRSRRSRHRAPRSTGLRPGGPTPWSSSPAPPGTASAAATGPTSPLSCAGLRTWCTSTPTALGQRSSAAPRSRLPTPNGSPATPPRSCSSRAAPGTGCIWAVAAGSRRPPRSRR